MPPDPLTPEQVLDAIDAHYDRMRQGGPLVDWTLVMVPTLAPPKWTDERLEAERLEALRRILSRMRGPPIHPARWKANRDTILAACEDLGVSVEGLAEARGWEAVEEAIGHLSPDELRAAPEEAMKDFRAALQRLVCDDLLGPDWRRHRGRETTLPDGPVEDKMAAEVDAAAATRAIVDTVPNEVHLSPALGELWSAYQETGGEVPTDQRWKLAGDRLGLSDAALRKRKQRLLNALEPLHETLRSD